MIVKVLYYLLFSAIFFLVYRSLYARMSFHRINRWVLLLIPPLSVLIAFIAPEFALNLGQETLLQIQLPEVIIEGERLTISPTYQAVPSLWSIIYFLGIGLSLLYFLSGLYLLYKLLGKASAEDYQGQKIYFSKHIKSAFCFASWVIIPEAQRSQANLDIIIKHELIHQKLGHSLDRIYYKVLTTLLWFDPFIHLFSKEIRQVHEYEVDAFILAEEENIENYAHMLLSSTMGADLAYPEKALSPSPFFNSSLIKSRITMMYKKQSPKWRKGLYLAAIPLLTAMTLFACNKSEEATAAVDSNTKTKTVSDLSKLDRLPVAPGCDGEASKEEIKSCAFNHIANHISSNFKYPDLAQEIGMEGRIMVSFVVNEDGKIADVEIARTDITGPEGQTNGEMGETMDNADRAKLSTAAEQAEMQSLELVESLPAFESGAQQDGKAVRLKMVIPIQLKLS